MIGGQAVPPAVEAAGVAVAFGRLDDGELPAGAPDGELPAEAPDGVEAPGEAPDGVGDEFAGAAD